MPRFTRAELEACRGMEVPDLLGDDVRLLFVGINPGLWTAATQTHFAHPANRFYPALLRAGIITRAVDPSAGMTDEDRDHLRSRGIGITNLVRRATARASELTDDELREGGRRLESLVAELRPRVVAVAGITAYRAAFADAPRRPRPAARRPERLRAVGGAEPERPERARDDRDPGRGVRRRRASSRGPDAQLRSRGGQPTRCGAAERTARSNGSPSIVTVPPTSCQEPPSTRYLAVQVVSTRVVTSAASS